MIYFKALWVSLGLTFRPQSTHYTKRFSRATKCVLVAWLFLWSPYTRGVYVIRLTWRSFIRSFHYRRIRTPRSLSWPVIRYDLLVPLSPPGPRLYHEKTCHPILTQKLYSTICRNPNLILLNIHTPGFLFALPNFDDNKYLGNEM